VAPPVPPRPELRVYLLVKDLQRQFAAYLGTPTRARGYPPFAGEHSLIVEVAPALAIERVTDLALRAVPTVEPGILFVERQFGVLEVHGPDLADVERAAPGVTLVDVSMIGVAGRIYLAGQAADVAKAQHAMADVLAAVEGRDHGGASDAGA